MKRLFFIAFLALTGCPQAPVVVTPPPPIKVNISPTEINVRRGDPPVTFTSTIEHDSSNAGGNWTLTDDGKPCAPACGTLTDNGDGTATYTPPK